MPRLSIANLIFHALMVHPEAFTAFVRPRKALAQKVSPVHMMPRLSDILVIHVHPVRLQIATHCRDLFER